MSLTGRDRAILDFEQSWWQRPGSKANAIRAELAMSPSAYYRRLQALADLPQALEQWPMLVRRLRRARADRRRNRFEGAAVPGHPGR